MKKLVLFLLTAVLFVGCFGKKEDIGAKVLGNTYILQNVLPESEVDINFEKDKIVGSSGVNRYFANYTLDGNKISIQNPGTTRMMGPENLMKQEQDYLKNLVDAKELELTENGISIVTNSGVKLNFVKK
ncbi:MULTISPECIES: META domain-containing protein [Cetobacterium]|uniref:META domain-containing protein n=1 Tax=Candidatus Cetobacterium colombiensis TaxID=3073100 RepID=A0ABU4W970_9FUSO|nr:META domain-containing protein [Candidatus Cetobacterium colombiensis]MDX8336062.1 META domain-containing protein [Candidatus Cetobacterium colombiensis]